MLNNDDLEGTAATLSTADQLFAEGKWMEAAERYQQALDILIAKNEDSQGEMPAIYSKLGNVCAALKDYQLAAEFYARAMDAYTTLKGESSPEVAATCNQLAEACHWLGAYKTAIDFYTRALNTYLQLPGTPAQDVAAIYSNLAFAHFDNGDNQQAETLMLQALKILQTLHPDGNNPAIKTMEQNLAFIRQNVNDNG